MFSRLEDILDGLEVWPNVALCLRLRNTDMEDTGGDFIGREILRTSKADDGNAMGIVVDVYDGGSDLR